MKVLTRAMITSMEKMSVLPMFRTISSISARVCAPKRVSEVPQRLAYTDT